MDKLLHSLKTVKMGEFLFKVSELNGGVMVVSYSPIFQYAEVRYFDSEILARDYIEYMVMQGEVCKQESKKDE